MQRGRVPASLRPPAGRGSRPCPSPRPRRAVPATTGPATPPAGVAHRAGRSSHAPGAPSPPGAGVRVGRAPAAAPRIRCPPGAGPHHNDRNGPAKAQCQHRPAPASLGPGSCSHGPAGRPPGGVGGHKGQMGGEGRRGHGGHPAPVWHNSQPQGQPPVGSRQALRLTEIGVPE